MFGRAPLAPDPPKTASLYEILPKWSSSTKSGFTKTIDLGVKFTILVELLKACSTKPSLMEITHHCHWLQKIPVGSNFSFFFLSPIASRTVPSSFSFSASFPSINASLQSVMLPVPSLSWKQRDQPCPMPSHLSLPRDCCLGSRATGRMLGATTCAAPPWAWPGPAWHTAVRERPRGACPGHAREAPGLRVREAPGLHAYALNAAGSSPWEPRPSRPEEEEDQEEAFSDIDTWGLPKGKSGHSHKKSPCVDLELLCSQTVPTVDFRSTGIKGSASHGFLHDSNHLHVLDY